MLATLDAATLHRLTSEDLARIDSYHGEGIDLHGLLGALTPRTCWYETVVTAQHGTVIHLGYLAAVSTEGAHVGFVGFAPSHGRLFGPTGPSWVTSTEMSRPDCTDEQWRELRAGVGIALRAMLLGCGEVMGG